MPLSFIFRPVVALGLGALSPLPFSCSQVGLLAASFPLTGVHTLTDAFWYMVINPSTWKHNQEDLKSGTSLQYVYIHVQLVSKTK